MLAIYAIVGDMDSSKRVSVTSAVRDYVRDRYVKPAVRAGKRSVRVRVGDVHREMKLNNRVPLVCQALTSKKFLEENSLRIVHRTGPASGQSTSVTLTYEIAGKERESNWAAFDAMYGKLRDVYARYGGGEKYLEMLRSDEPAFPPEEDI